MGVAILKEGEGSPKKDKYGLFVQNDNKKFLGKKQFEKAKTKLFEVEN
jgi:hypothetical protein